MRDIALTAFVFALLPFVFTRPHWGVLLWTWIGLMNPHRLTWGFAFDFPFAVVVGITTLIAVAISREPKRIPWQPVVIVLLLLAVWMTISTVFSLYPTAAWGQWQKVAKIQLFIFVTLMVMWSRERIVALVWVATLSLAFYGVKGGIYTLTGGGVGMVLGPDGGFIAGNTEISLALTMTIPLLRWLQLQSDQRWLRWGLGLSMVLVAMAVLGSQSRGGFLAIIGMVVFLWLKSERKVLAALILATLVPFALMAMPDAWFQRMATIQTYEQDGSAMGRINAWGFAINLAQSRPLLGGGFRAFDIESFRRWAPNPNDVHDAHSIWFQILGEHGFVGLALYLLLWILAWRTGKAILRDCRGREPLRWASDLAAMLQVSIIGFWVGGSFLGLAYWDFPYVLIALLVLTRVVVLKHLMPEAQGAATSVGDVTTSGRSRESRPTNATG